MAGGTRMPKDAPKGRMPTVTPKTSTFVCSCCGKSFTKQNNNFMQTNSPLFANNSGFLPYCKSCCEKFYEQLLAVYDGEPKKAIKECCRTFGWYWSETIYAGSLKNVGTNTPLVSYYLQVGGNNGAPAGYTFLNTLSEDNVRVINEDIDEMPEVRTATVQQMKMWGTAYEVEEYKTLDYYYDDLTSEFKASDPVQEKLIRDLCVQRLLQDRALKRGDFDTYDKASKLYHSTLKAGNLEVRSKDDEDPNASYGNMIKTMENFSPAEYYKDKKLFKDYDGIKDYFERFILRPMKNFFTGSNVQDEEYSIKVGDESDED